MLLQKTLWCFGCSECKRVNLFNKGTEAFHVQIIIPLISYPERKVCQADDCSTAVSSLRTAQVHLKFTCSYSKFESKTLELVQLSIFTIFLWL